MVHAPHRKCPRHNPVDSNFLFITCVAMVCALAPSALYAVPTPDDVFGKEYSNMFDKNAVGALDPHQVISWDGFGATVDAFDYTSGVPFLLVDHEVDAIANSRDRFFSAMTFDTAPMLLSFSGMDNIHYQEAGPGGATGVWATASEINSMPGALDDVDGLEVWGPIDSNHFSMMFDPAPGPGSPRIAVWYFDDVAGSVVPYILIPDLATAIGVTTGIELLDLDALMVSDRDNDGVWGDGDSIMFSVRANIDGGGTFDGGEVWVWTSGSPAAFLDHGGVTWDTANSVGALFGVPTEEIDALEAVPEPATLSVLGLMSGLALIRRRR